MNKLIKFKIFALLVSLASACGGGKHKTPSPEQVKKQQEKMVDINRLLVQRESDEIDQYVKRQGWDMVTTGTGLRYMIYERGNGERAITGKFVKVTYKIYLLDGTVCYSSEKDGPREFLVGKDNVESGIHEGITYMQVGDKARFILPSHLAHGLLGDNDKIPPRASIVYDIELLSLR